MRQMMQKSTGFSKRALVPVEGQGGGHTAVSLPPTSALRIISGESRRGVATAARRGQSSVTVLQDSADRPVRRRCFGPTRTHTDVNRMCAELPGKFTARSKIASLTTLTFVVRFELTHVRRQPLLVQLGPHSV